MLFIEILYTEGVDFLRLTPFVLIIGQLLTQYPISYYTNTLPGIKPIPYKVLTRNLTGYWIIEETIDFVCHFLVNYLERETVSIEIIRGLYRVDNPKNDIY